MVIWTLCIIRFWSVTFTLPEMVIKQINSLFNSFLWHETLDNAAGARVSWDAFSYPKAEGDLGLRSLSSWNVTCGLKLIWMLFFRSGSIWVAWIRHKYLKRSSFWSLNDQNNSHSWMFWRILKLCNIATSFLKIQIVNGDDFFFWWDPWSLFGILCQHLGPLEPTSLGVPLSALVSDVITSDGYSITHARSDSHLELLAFISSLSVSPTSNKLIYSINGTVYSRFISKNVWETTRPTKPQLPWFSLVWLKSYIPKHSTTVWLFTLNRNLIANRLSSWGLVVEEDCLLCGLGMNPETIY